MPPLNHKPYASWTVAVARESKSKPVDRCVLFALANYADPSGECFPGTEALMNDVGTGKAQITDSLNRLVGLGELVLLEKGRRGRASTYRLTLGGVPATIRDVGRRDEAAAAVPVSILPGTEYVDPGPIPEIIPALMIARKAVPDEWLDEDPELEAICCTIWGHEDEHAGSGDTSCAVDGHWCGHRVFRSPNRDGWTHEVDLEAVLS